MSREARVAKNEVLFREVNERIRELAPAGDAADFLCECGDAGCVEPVGLTLADYERVRQDPTRFFVRPGHEMSDIEDVVERNDAYVVVMKRSGTPADIADANDPRA